MAQRHGLILSAALIAAAPVYGQGTGISEERSSLSFAVNGQTIVIDRNGAACPPNCLQPMQAAAGVVTIGELELLDFLEIFVGAGQGLLIDARLPSSFASGTIPGAVNVPTQTLGPTNPYRDDLLAALGVRNGDFSGAFDLVLFGNGADSPDVPQAVRSLIDAGYPPAKLKYYRGGVASWKGYGLTVAPGG